MATSFVLNQCLRAEGSAVFSMIGMVAGAVLNVGLDPLFIFTFGWGVAGASAATAISKVVSWCILMTPYFRKRRCSRSASGSSARAGATPKGLRHGQREAFRNGLGTLAGILLNRIAVGYGTSALAAINVANRITMFMTSACLGFGQGFQPVAGFSWGAKRFDRVRESFRFSMIACVAGISAVALVVGIFARPILLLFTEDDAELVRIGVFSLRIQCLAMPFHGFGIIVNMLCSGIGRALPSLLLGLARQGICFFPILPLMVRLWGVWGIASVQGAADMLVMLLAVPIAVRVSRDIRRREAEQGRNIPGVSFSREWMFMLDFFLWRGILFSRNSMVEARSTSVRSCHPADTGERKGAIAEGSHRCLAVDAWGAEEHSADCHFGGELSLLRI